ncbi:unnamed protein product [Clavelina lepadiformis]|uniref:Pleckstrin homology domain-containing family J member 1 n=1 Tax=Clavelina lepadiformis TaxID=159417 RepID=A0ABP0G081_CLALP
MRFNALELKQFALSSQAHCIKEGLLSLREKEGKLWNKTDVLTERWFRLIGNLLFYMKGKTKSSEPFGVFVLEKFTVRPEEEYSFVLEFEGAEETVYFLASGQAEASAWIKALKDASYTHLKQKYQDLQKEARRLQAQVELL